MPSSVLAMHIWLLWKSRKNFRKFLDRHLQWTFQVPCRTCFSWSVFITVRKISQFWCPSLWSYLCSTDVHLHLHRMESRVSLSKTHEVFHAICITKQHTVHCREPCCASFSWCHYSLLLGRLTVVASTQDFFFCYRIMTLWYFRCVARLQLR